MKREATDKSHVVHPAKFSNVIIEEIRQVLAVQLPEGGRVLVSLPTPPLVENFKVDTSGIDYLSLVTAVPWRKH